MSEESTQVSENENAKRPRVGVAGGLLRLALVLGMLVSIPGALVVLFVSPVSPTPTQAALAGWMVWLVPGGALALEWFARGRVVERVLAIGWGSTIVCCVIAALAFRGYPQGGPHEAIAIGVFAGAVAMSFVLGAPLRARFDRPRVASTIGIAIVVLAMFGGGVSFRLFMNESAWALPITSYPVRRYHFVDIAGSDVQYASAPIGRAGLDALVRDLGLVRRESSRPRSHDAFAPSWFRVDEADELYVDPTQPSHFDPDEISSDDWWCWSHASWNGTHVMLSRGCAWM